jgi:hypothetical protein
MRTRFGALRRLATQLAIAAALVSATGPLALAQSSGAPKPATLVAATAPKPLIQVAILLDTSGSMDGLINQARASLWRIVTELARARRQGQKPELQVALYEYGNDGAPASEGHVRQVVPLTTDLDRISEQLFALTTNGGEEYCGAAITKATNQLEWSDKPGTLKLVFIAGNEAFTQGTVDYKGAAKAAIGKGIVVNTIFCGPESEGVSTGWQDGARLADGRFTFIDSNQQVAAIAAPQDAELSRLGEELNRTYLAYGRKGAEKKKRMEAQDKEASGMGGSVAADRAQAKAMAAAPAADWDLVEATQSGAAAPAEIAQEELPAELQGKSAAEQTEIIEKLGKQRGEIQKKIEQLSEERRKFVEAKQRESAEGGASTFDKAVLEAIQEQGKRQNFEFSE